MAAVLVTAARAPVFGTARVERAAREPFLALVAVEAGSVQRRARAAMVGARMGLHARARAAFGVRLATLIAELAVEHCERDIIEHDHCCMNNEY